MTILEGRGRRLWVESSGSADGDEGCWGRRLERWAAAAGGTLPRTTRVSTDSADQYAASGASAGWSLALIESR